MRYVELACVLFIVAILAAFAIDLYAAHRRESTHKRATA